MRWWRAIFEKLRADIRLAMICLLGALAAITILPFAALRAANGQWTAVVIDVLVVAVIAGNALFAWRTGRTRLAGSTVVVLVTIGCVGIQVALGLEGLLWVYTVMIANFMLGPRLLAMAANLALMASPFLLPAGFPAPDAQATFLATAALVTLYGFIFSWLVAFHHSQMEALATRDALTGTANRRVMETEVPQAVATHHSRRLPAGLAVLDLDHFKLVNDQHGHDAGDRVLVAFAEILRRNLRKSDRLYRFGGEEFAVLFPATDRDGVEVVLEKLLQRIREELRGPSGPVRASIGAAMLTGDDDWSSWMMRADGALYQAKRTGRDRICIEGDRRCSPERCAGSA
ncbi:GGDEF domain-containing protein [Luteimonas sp. SJ-92]|uniref:diguanylate cyclase n=1 Tax=Luteimonas salinisoli TaxID=2752307 RepID=A0A853JEC3_9GAMM|nr:GGDEF domain-containing protein [Luteimonas salinisoli]NZA27104.1 GGDEF domain-containing protein [Luteimonas salinisoli]